MAEKAKRFHPKPQQPYKKRADKREILLDDIPAYIKTFAKSKALPPILFGVKGDLTDEGEYCEYWVLADTLGITILRGYADKGSDSWKAESQTRYTFQELQSLKAENFFSTGALIGVFKSCEKILCQYTNTSMHKMVRLVQLCEKLRKHEAFSNEDYLASEKQQRCPKCGRLYPDQSRPICPKCLKRVGLFRRILGYALHYKASIIIVFLLMGAMSAIGTLTPIVNGIVLYDWTLTAGGRWYGHIVLVVMLLLGMSGVSTLMWILQGRVNAVLSAKIVYDIKLELFDALQKLSMKFYNGKQTGSLMTRVNNDALDIQYVLNDGMPNFVVNLVTLVAMTIVMLIMNPLLTLLIYLPVPIVVYIIKFVMPRFYRLKWRTFVKTSKLNSLMSDSFSSMRVVKAFGKERSEENRFDNVSTELYHANVRAGRQGALTFPVLGFVMGLGSLFVSGFGGWQTVKGAMTFGEMITFLNFLGYIYGPINWMMNIFDWWANCMNSAQRIFEILDRKPDIVEKANPVEIPHIQGDISIKHMTFSYEPNKPVLHEISLDIKAGEMIGMVGHSGAGKSTITNLITRLYDVDEGSISIDGVDVRDIRMADLRSQIGMVLQETFLFTGTVAENIAYAKPSATREEIISAAKLANAHEFIMKLSDGYETELGKKQLRLSGGEQQRISIARAILVNPRILILDEATASVDTETEAGIQEALERLTKGRTTIAVAHRLSTLRKADRIVVVEKGSITEVGTHKELEEKKGGFFKMMEIQKEALKIRGLEDSDDSDDREEKEEAPSA